MKEREASTELPFEGTKVYYSGSIKGTPEADPEFAWKLVQYMARGGADVLSEHVAGRTPEERENIRASRIGTTIDELAAMPEPWFHIRQKDVEWVDEASHVVALVNAPSLGVGMELERALLKPDRGLPETPILCLVHEENLESLSFMVRGVNREEYPFFRLETYTDLDTATSHIDAFLKVT